MSALTLDYARANDGGTTEQGQGAYCRPQKSDTKADAFSPAGQSDAKFHDEGEQYPAPDPDNKHLA